MPPITNGQIANASIFINESEKNATPASDNGRVPKLENDGKLHPYFVRLGKQINCGETINGGSTPVPVYQNKSDNELYACDGNDTGKLKFIGFVTSNSTDGNPARFQGAGIVGGFSALAEGEKYYVQNDAGTIGTTPGTYQVLVGVAISETELLIEKGLLRAGGSIMLSGSISNQVITTGYRPSKIRIMGAFRLAGSSNIRVSDMVLAWQNGVVASMSGAAGIGETSDYGVNANAILYSGDTSDNYVAVGISDVTDAGFTITLQEIGNFSSGGLLWEAEGGL